MNKPIQTDVLIVGAGLAGTMLVLELREQDPDLDILLLGDPGKAATALAQGGIAAVLPGTDDAISRHVEDTWEAGDHFGSRTVIESIIADAPKLIDRLEHWGVRFDRGRGGYDLAREGGHSRARVLHHQDSSGDHVLSVLRAQLRKLHSHPIEMIRLVTTTSGRIIGVQGWDYINQKEVNIHARATVLATGGLGQLFRYTSNPEGAYGQGLSAAMACGTATRDLPFIQYHPTAFYEPGVANLSLITEALRGAGAILRNHTGKAIMEGVHPQKDLAPRDHICRAMYREMIHEEVPHLFLDATSVSPEAWKRHFPMVMEICMQDGVDPTQEWIPVVPAAHYSCGGIAALANGITQKVGLYAIGEVACTGFHGANRLASNSLLEAGVMAINLSNHLRKNLAEHGEWSKPDLLVWDGLADFTEVQDRVKEIFQNHLGVIKETIPMEIGLKRLTALQEEWNSEPVSISQIKIHLLLELSIAIFRESLARKRNAGVFYNADLVNEEAPSS